MRTDISALLVIALAVLWTPVQAAGTGHAAHEHGVSKLDIAFDGSNLEIELSSPGMDIVGFEHAAATPGDKETVSNALSALRAKTGTISLPAAAECSLREAHATFGEDEHGHHAATDHREISAHWHFSCTQPDQLTHVDVDLFDLFPNIGTVEVRAITSRGQVGAKLTAKQRRLKF